MKIKISTLIIVLLVFATIIFYHYRKTYPQIKLSCEQINFGTADQDQTLKLSIKVANRGNKLLKINNVIPDCGCTVVKSDFCELKPGKIGNVNLQYNTGKGEGPVEKKVTIISNDPINDTKVIKIKGIIKPSILISPNKIDFGRVKNKSIEKRKIDIYIKRDEPVIIEQVASSDTNLHVSIIKINNKMYRVELIMRPNTVEEKYQSEIQITTSLKERRNITVPIIAKITGDINSKTNGIFLTSKGADIPLEDNIVISSESNRPFKIVSILSTDPNAIRVRTEINKLKSTHRIHLEIIADTDEVKKVSGEIKVYTDRKDQPVVTIPVYAIL